MRDLIGEVRCFARVDLPPDWRACDGSALAIAEHQPLFSLLGWRFGGDWWTTFRLPLLHARGPAPGVAYAIALNGLYPTREGTMLHAHVGEIRLFAGQYPPDGWLPCDGRELPIEAPYLELYEIIGKTWGGGDDTFALPNLWNQSLVDTHDVGKLSYIVAIATLDAATPHADDETGARADRRVRESRQGAVRKEISAEATATLTRLAGAM